MSDDQFFIPVSAMEMPRFAGMPSFMRLPHLEMGSPRIDEVEMGLVGVPWDAGTTNRPGPRHGPRQLRDLSTMIRAMNPVTGVNPFTMVNCADLGDVGPNPIDLDDIRVNFLGPQGVPTPPHQPPADGQVHCPLILSTSSGQGPSWLHGPMGESI